VDSLAKVTSASKSLYKAAQRRLRSGGF